MKTKLTRICAIALLLVLCRASVPACGPFSMEAVFVYTVHPAYPLERFAKGQLGVVQPSYARSYLFVAYRYLANLPLASTEQQAVVHLWKERLGGDYEPTGGEWVRAWFDARKQVPNVPEPAQLDVFRNREKPNEYESYLNCRPDAFQTAVGTLNERIKKYGADSQQVRTWLEGQNQVFTNCASGSQIPNALPDDADSLSKADRNYQIAAANFYATNLDDALKGFESIAADSSSPWQPAAPYLVARTLIRKASLGPDEKKTEVYGQAENQLKKILDNKKLENFHHAANRLLDLVTARLHPAERLHELAHDLTDKNPNADLKQHLWDYTILLDGVLESEDATKKPSKETLRADDLTDWLATLQGNSNEDTEHALTRWQATHSATWLVASLSKVDSRNAQTSSLIREALNVKPSSPAFASARFHAVRLLIESGKTDEARTMLDPLLKNNRDQFDSSSLNLLISERMMVATSLADFLAHAPRVPAALSWNDDGREIPSEAADVSDEAKHLVGKSLFDFDAAELMNKKMPVTLLKEAAIATTLPAHLRRDLAQATWIRAVLVGDYKTADEIVPTLKSLVPELTASLDDFVKTTQPEAKKFTALYIWLKFPGIEPVVDQGIGREETLNKQDSYRDNWWCGAAIVPSPEVSTSEEEEEITSFTSATIKAPAFLDAAQLSQGQKEWTTLSSLGAMPNYLSRQVIQWTTKNPADPRSAEALALAVNSTRHGCTDKDTGRWSKAAFDLLHRKYPNTTWAKKTKYWFKE